MYFLNTLIIFFIVFDSSISLGAKSNVKLNDLRVTPLNNNSIFGFNICPLVRAKIPGAEVFPPN